MFTFSLSKPTPFIPLCLGKGIRSFVEPWASLGVTSLVRLEDEQAPLKWGWREAERHRSLIQLPLAKAGDTTSVDSSRDEHTSRRQEQAFVIMSSV